MPQPHQATIYFHCIFCDAFFMTLQFSDLVPYVAILKTFQVKKNFNSQNHVLRTEWRKITFCAPGSEKWRIAHRVAENKFTYRLHSAFGGCKYGSNNGETFTVTVTGWFHFVKYFAYGLWFGIGTDGNIWIDAGCKKTNHETEAVT